jgi:putative tryptophan/tyrosine transport system substrate-binding protein
MRFLRLGQAMKRRSFIALVGGAAAWPFAARAQQREQVRRVGILLPATADDTIWQDRVGSFLQALGLLGWTIGRNVRIDTRWATNNAAEIRRHALELAALAPDAILAGGTSSIAPLLQATRTVPIVFTIANDPVGAGFVATHGRGSGMSVAGAKQTSQRHGSMSALRVKRTFT